MMDEHDEKAREIVEAYNRHVYMETSVPIRTLDDFIATALRAAAAEANRALVWAAEWYGIPDEDIPDEHILAFRAARQIRDGVGK